MSGCQRHVAAFQILVHSGDDSGLPARVRPNGELALRINQAGKQGLVTHVDDLGVWRHLDLILVSDQLDFFTADDDDGIPENGPTRAVYQTCCLDDQGTLGLLGVRMGSQYGQQGNPEPESRCAVKPDLPTDGQAPGQTIDKIVPCS